MSCDPLPDRDGGVLVGRQPDPLHVDRTPGPADDAVVVEDGDPAVVDRARDERRGVGVQHVRDLAGHVGGDGLGRHGAVGDRSRGTQHALQVPGPPRGTGLLTPAPQGDLRHRHADQDQEHRGLDVVPVVDGERVVGRHEEEVEPRAGRHRGQEAGGAIAGCCCAHDDEHQDQDAGGRRDLVPGRREDAAHEEGQDDRCDPGDRRRLPLLVLTLSSIPAPDAT